MTSYLATLAYSRFRTLSDATFKEVTSYEKHTSSAGLEPGSLEYLELKKCN